MTDEEIRERAERVADAADHPSVRSEVLAGDAGEIAKSYLGDRPAVTYLDDDETVAYVFRSDGKGVGIGGRRDTTSPTDGLSAVTMVTDRRTLCVVGQSTGDAVVEVPHDDVRRVEFKNSLLGSKRLVVRTDRTVYLFFAGSSVGTDVLDGAASHVHRHVEPSDAGSDDDDDDDGGGSTGPGGALFSG